MLRVEDVTRGTVVVEGGRTAKNYWTRLRGLIGVKRLDPGDGLAIVPSNGVHCMFMSIPIDVIYVDCEHRVVDVDANMKPWAIGRPRRAARYVIELPAGAAERAGVRPGDQLVVTF
jgi:uncharacterized membrane protein (UPF0127 family)